MMQPNQRCSPCKHGRHKLCQDETSIGHGDKQYEIPCQCRVCHPDRYRGINPNYPIYEQIMMRGHP